MSSPSSISEGPSTLLTIGAVAALAGKRPSSIRYYEEIGLLPEPVRVSGRRVYDSGVVRGTMKLLGKRNWYLPGWLQWLPHLEPEEPSIVPAKPAHAS